MIQVLASRRRGVGLVPVAVLAALALAAPMAASPAGRVNAIQICPDPVRGCTSQNHSQVLL